MLHDVSLADRFDLAKETVLLGGIQALVALGAMNNPDDEKARLAADALSTLKATTRDKTLLLDMSVPSKTMKELIQSAQPPIESAKPRTVAPADDKGL